MRMLPTSRRSCTRRRLAVHVGARAAVAADDAANGKLPLAADGLLIEPALELARTAHDVKGRRDLGTLGAVTHHLRAGAAAGEELQRIDDDGFAGARLAGEHRESRAPFDLERIDDGEVADLQRGEHAGLARMVVAAVAPVQLRAQ